MPGTSDRVKKNVLDLLESIMKPYGLVKEELRRILFKMSQLEQNIKNQGFALFGCPQK